MAVGKKHNDIATTLKAKPTGKQLAVTDPKTLKMAEALRWEINHYGPTSSDDSIDRQIIEILSIQPVTGAPDSDDKSYKIKVKFKVIADGEDTGNQIIYEGMVYEDSKEHITAGRYDYVDS